MITIDNNLKFYYMASNEPGYVYILTNPSFREDWVKIGKSSRPVDVRSKERESSGQVLDLFITRYYEE